ncbi:hypothetical protein [Streptomyces sp. NPDC127177]|uniref:hypothetical protein n=1 Tax=Streptomyces sp. NPDC127177 TaxID=3345384 RepID=UPI003633C5C9
MSGRTPGRPFPVGPEWLSESHGVPAGHRRALMADTVGPLRTEHSPAGSQLTFPSSARTVVGSVPLHEK